MSLRPHQETLALTNSIGTTATLPYGQFIAGRIANNSGGPLTFDWHCSGDDSTYSHATDVATSGASTVADGESVEVPTGLAGASFLKLVLNSGTATVTFYGK